MCMVRKDIIIRESENLRKIRHQNYITSKTKESGVDTPYNHVLTTNLN